jgi:glycosyltransferase involved in cell wall biosynthesis
VEALASGVASVFTKSGIALEFVEHLENAWVVDYRDSDAIYRGITSLLEDPGLRQKLRENGYRCVAGSYSLERMMAALHDLYRSSYRSRKDQ